MRGCRETGDAIEGWPEVVAAAKDGNAGMQADADDQFADGGRPRFAGQRDLRGDRRTQGILGAIEGAEERVADGFKNDPGIPLDRFAKEFVVADQSPSHRSARTLP